MFAFPFNLGDVHSPGDDVHPRGLLESSPTDLARDPSHHGLMAPHGQALLSDHAADHDPGHEHPGWVSHDHGLHRADRDDLATDDLAGEHHDDPTLPGHGHGLDWNHPLGHATPVAPGGWVAYPHAASHPWWGICGDPWGNLDHQHRQHESDTCAIASRGETVAQHARLPGQQANHAIELVGVQGLGTPHPTVILNDPGRPQGRGMVVVASTFLRARDAIKQFMVSTTGRMLPTGPDAGPLVAGAACSPRLRSTP